ncbi:hypothetical protein R75461_08107 [Paraburkholderia nemoris]|nr:hypothetical protein R75461_08107 [Paraburkholderia nemoris]
MPHAESRPSNDGPVGLLIRSCSGRPVSWYSPRSFELAPGRRMRSTAPCRMAYCTASLTVRGCIMPVDTIFTIVAGW